MKSSNHWARLYFNVSLIDCDSADALDDLLAHTTLSRLVVQRLSDRAIIVDGEQKALIARALNRRGQTFRIVDLPPVLPDSLPNGDGQ